jgi:antitoxin ParD1/3/4/toxin ParE1/3/4
MSRYRLSRPAQQDLRDIVDYIAQDNAPAARRLLAKLKAAFRELAGRPGMGHRREDLTDLPVRFLAVGSYLVVYADEQRPIEMVRVLHGARDVEAILGSLQ